jgi:hypothetical protein
VAETLTLPPDPARLIEGLRDTGYQFNTALADIVDNSIAASATLVDIGIHMDMAGDVTVFVADNGCGMDHDGLINAMRYGSQLRPDAKSLGKFGLGLKTASTSCCRRLSVVTRANAVGPIEKAIWDLDHVVEAAAWELLLEDPTTADKSRLESTASAHSGTLVKWERCDRILKKQFANPGGAVAQKAIKTVVDAFREHAATVYQRFLDPEDNRAATVTMRINGEPVVAWDPFCRHLEGTEIVAQGDVPVEFADGSEGPSFTITAYVLPHKDDIPEGQRAEAKIGNDRQGIYIYRESRLIHQCDWLGLYRKEPHFSLLRVEFSFNSDLDDAFHVDIKKSQVVLDQALAKWLGEEFLPAPRRAAEDRYRKVQQRTVKSGAEVAHASANRAIASMELGLRQSQIQITDAATGEVEVTNRGGVVRLRLSVSSSAHPGEVVVEPVDGINDGLLWEPAVIDTRHGVRINTSHPFYHKVYVPNYDSGLTVQGLDSLLWSLGEAELGTISESTKKHFRDLRYEVSKILRELVDEMPEPEAGGL